MARLRHTAALAGSPVFVGKFGFDVADVVAGAVGAEPDLASGAVLDNPGQCHERRQVGTWSATTGAAHVGLGHEATVRRTCR